MRRQKSLHKSTSNVSILGVSFQAVTSMPDIELNHFQFKLCLDYSITWQTVHIYRWF